jgi:hypothetical protein
MSSLKRCNFAQLKMAEINTFLPYVVVLGRRGTTDSFVSSKIVFGEISRAHDFWRIGRVGIITNVSIAYGYHEEFGGVRVNSSPLNFFSYLASHWMCGAPDNCATQMSLTLTLSRQRERELRRRERDEVWATSRSLGRALPGLPGRGGRRRLIVRRFLYRAALRGRDLRTMVVLLRFCGRGSRADRGPRQ